MGAQLNPPTTLTPNAEVFSAAAAALNAGVSVPCREVLIQAAPSNSVSLFVGTVASQPIELTPGSAVTIPIDNVIKVYCATASSTATANWLASGN